MRVGGRGPESKCSVYNVFEVGRKQGAAISKFRFKYGTVGEARNF